MHTAGRARLSWRAARFALTLAVLAAAVTYVIRPELRGTHLSVLGHLRAPWLAAGALLQAMAQFCYTLLTRSLLPPRSLRLGQVFRIDLACSALCHSVPAGTAASAALGYRLYTSRGVKPADMCLVLACQGPGSSVVLNLLLWVALAAAVPFTGLHGSYLAAAAAGLVLLTAFGGAALAATRGEERAVRLARSAAGRIPWLTPETAERPVRAFAAAARGLRRDRRRMRRALQWAAAHWLLKAASLWCFLTSLGSEVNPVVLFAAFGIASVAAALPVTPAGLGVIEAALPLLLAGHGVTAGIAAVAVLGWRLVSFWLPIPAGAAAYLSLHLPRRGTARAPAGPAAAMAVPAGTVPAGTMPARTAVSAAGGTR